MSDIVHSILIVAGVLWLLVIVEKVNKWAGDPWGYGAASERAAFNLGRAIRQAIIGD